MPTADVYVKIPEYSYDKLGSVEASSHEFGFTRYFFNSVWNMSQE